MAEAFTFFWKSRLSQWHRSPFTISGVTFSHAEQYMMYTKALLFGEQEAVGGAGAGWGGSNDTPATSSTAFSAVSFVA